MNTDEQFLSADNTSRQKSLVGIQLKPQNALHSVRSLSGLVGEDRNVQKDVVMILHGGLHIVFTVGSENNLFRFCTENLLFTIQIVA